VEAEGSAVAVGSEGSEVEVLVVVVPAAVGNLQRGIPMIPDKLINEFRSRTEQAAGPNLESIILYGSAASDSFDPEFSNINLLCLLKDTGFLALRSLSPVMDWWSRQKQVAPLIMTRKELLRSADVFTIELVDMKRHHRVLLGDDVLQSLSIPMQLHRVQVEYELREKLLLLRQSVLLSANKKNRLWELLLGSVASFATLFRHALIAIGDETGASRRDSISKIADRVPFDAQPFLQVLDVREHKLDPKHIDVEQLCARYLTVVEQVTAAVDKMLDSTAP
jgi:hypothetical protein